MNGILNLSRRNFLKVGALAAGGLILGAYIPDPAHAAEGEARKAGTLFDCNAFVRIGTDDTVVIVCNHSEMGQGIYTSLALLVAEELDADWGKVRVESAPVDPAYNHTEFGMQATGGSTSTRTEWERLRKMGASARAMLVAAAAAIWKVDPATCTTEKGVIRGGGRTLRYGEVVANASQLKAPAEVPLKKEADFKLIGKATPRIEARSKTDGSAVFGLDVQLPGMLVAVVERCPVFGGKVKSFDATRTKQVPGVRDVVQIDRGVAVVAEGFWSAKQGRDALEVSWDEGPLAALDSAAMRTQYRELANQAGVTARNDGDAPGALAKATGRIEAEYDMPYLAHAPMEPLNCVADVRPDSCEIWTGTQFQTLDCAAAARTAGLQPAQVKVHTTLLGGGFGRRAVPDSHFVIEAVQVSKAVKAPVKVIWTREDDIRGGYYRPAVLHKVSASLDGDGRPQAWDQKVVCQSFIRGTVFEPMIIQNNVDHIAVEGSEDMPYAIPNVRVSWVEAPGGVPCLWLRSVGHTHNAFVVETMLDELAFSSGKDPVEFRRSLLGKSPRRLAALNLAVEKSGWGSVVIKGHGRGVAVHESFGSVVAQVVEVSLGEGGLPRIHRVVCAIDCGPVVNPEGVKAQMEGAIVFGLTLALHGKITFSKGRVQQRNFHDYPLLRMNEMPEVEVHIVPSKESMGGVGEPGVPPVAPALANALFGITGKRLRRLPILAEDLRA